MGRTCRLLGVQADSVVGDDSGGGRRHLELFSGELQHGSERGGLGHAQTGGGGVAQESYGGNIAGMYGIPSGQTSTSHSFDVIAGIIPVRC